MLLRRHLAPWRPRLAKRAQDEGNSGSADAEDSAAAAERARLDRNREQRSKWRKYTSDSRRRRKARKEAAELQARQEQRQQQHSASGKGDAPPPPPDAHSASPHSGKASTGKAPTAEAAAAAGGDGARGGGTGTGSSRPEPATPPPPPPRFDSKFYNRVISRYASLHGAAPHLTLTELATLRTLLDGKNRYQDASKRLRALRQSTTKPDPNPNPNTDASSGSGDDSRRSKGAPTSPPLTPAQQAAEAARLADELAQTRHVHGALKRFGLALAKRVGALPRTWLDHDALTPLPPGVPDALAVLERAAAAQLPGGMAELERRGAQLAREMQAKQRQRQQSGGGGGGRGDGAGGVAGWRGRLELLVQEAQALEASSGGGRRRASWLSAYGDAAGVSYHCTTVSLELDHKRRGDESVVGIRRRKRGRLLDCLAVS
jgi:hypothetical protein